VRAAAKPRLRLVQTKKRGQRVSSFSFFTQTSKLTAMKAHVQALFRTHYNAQQIKDAEHLIQRLTKRVDAVDLEEIPDSEFDAITAALQPAEFIVQIVRSADPAVALSGATNMKIKADEGVLAAIRQWVIDQATYDANAVDLTAGEVLVVVKAEHCSTCSSGHACP
jgi:hypothetical protein